MVTHDFSYHLVPVGGFRGIPCTRTKRDPDALVVAVNVMSISLELMPGASPVFV